MSTRFNFAEMIRATRESLGETQAEFAKRFNSHGHTVSRWETGQYEAPNKVVQFILAAREPSSCPLCKGRGTL